MSARDQERLRELATHSVELIRAHQAPTGAYLASPTFSVYRYCWLRDGAFIADAMSRAGQIESAEAFFGWCAAVLVERRAQVDDLLARHAVGAQIPASDFLQARYTVDGRETGADWWDFQLDGYGAWLWALDAHAMRHGNSITPYAEGVAISARYIAAFWDVASYDWWEEHLDERHTSTLAALAAGVRAARLRAELPIAVRSAAATAERAIRATIDADAARLGRFAKWLGGDGVDASLIALAYPFGIVAADDPLMVATLDAIETTLVHDRGVHRYVGDTYYGGGQWLLLAGFLGAQYHALGRDADAWAELRWIAEHAEASGDLPEQVDDHLLAPDRRAEWIERWGPVATPLLWSHAMYLTLALELGATTATATPAAQ